MAIEERKLAVLRAIIEDFISTNEPVGSKSLADRHNLGVSPATIRNDMALLEEEGLIAQPHTSAGPHPHRRRLPAVRRPAHRAQAALGRREARDRDVPRRRGRPRRRAAPRGARARAADPARRRRAVPDAVPLAGAPSGAGLGEHDPADARPDHRHRARRAAPRRTARRRSPTPRCSTCARRSTSSCATGCSPRRRSSSHELPPQVPAELRGLLATLTAVLLEALVETHSDRVVLGGTANLTVQRAGLPGDPAGARGARGAGRPAAPAGPVGRDDAGRRAHRQRDAARGAVRRRPS